MMAEARKAILSDLGTEGVLRITRRLFEQALGGDVNAARVLLLYAVGKPTKAADPDNVDLDEWSKADAMPSLCRVWSRMLENISPQQALQLLRDALQTRSGLGIKDLPPADIKRVVDEMRSRVGK
jgi:hypothetical protein